MRKALISLLVVAAACGAPQPVLDSGTPDSGAPPDAGPYEPPVVKRDHSLFWTDPVLLDDKALISFAGLLAIAAPDNHGGRLLQQWFKTYSSTGVQHTAPESFLDSKFADAGTDPTQWDLTKLEFRVTGVHNRIDLAKYGAGGHCGELRASAASFELELPSFHALFIFRQPAGAGDTGPDGGVTCEATARRWAELTRLDADALRTAVRAEIRDGFLRDRFLLIETVEQTISPWEWRQWVKGPASGPLPFTLENPPLFQQLDVEGLKPDAGTQRRADFVQWVETNAAALEARSLLIPDAFRVTTSTATDLGSSVLRTRVQLDGVSAGVLSQFPRLRANLELVGCVACHTTDADFVQTNTQRVVSPFYDKELAARERHLEKIAKGLSPFAPFGPLQETPVLPP